MLIKNLIVSLLFCIPLVCSGQNDDERKLRYGQEKSRIEELENKAQYHGDDEVIRKRLDLPPKILPFELWEPQAIKREEITQEKIIDKTETKEEEVIEVKKVNDVQSKEIREPFSMGILLIYILTPIIFLSLNFILYRKKVLRRFLITPPFGIGGGNVTVEDEINEATKSKRMMIESGMFLGTCFVIFLPLMFGLNKVGTSKVGVFEEFIATVVFYFIGHILNVIGEIYAAYATRCPSCKNSYARKLINKYDEPKSTYKRDVTKGETEHREVGVTHSNWSCTVCAHDWRTAKSYDKIIKSTYHS